MRQALAATICSVILLAMACGGDDGGISGTKRYEACEIVKQFVSDRLTSPGSASWQRCGEVTVERTGDTWRLDGYVDSQNRLGALLRTHYTAVVEEMAGGSWRLHALNLD